MKNSNKDLENLQIQMALQKHNEAKEFEAEFKGAYKNISNYNEVAKQRKTLNSEIEYLQSEMDKITRLIHKAENVYSIYYDDFDIDRENLITLKREIESVINELYLQKTKDVNQTSGKKTFDDLFSSSLKWNAKEKKTFKKELHERFSKMIIEDYENGKKETLNWLLIHLIKEGYIIEAFQNKQGKKGVFKVYKSFFLDNPDTNIDKDYRNYIGRYNVYNENSAKPKVLREKIKPNFDKIKDKHIFTI